MSSAADQVECVPVEDASSQQQEQPVVIVSDETEQPTVSQDDVGDSSVPAAVATEQRTDEPSPPETGVDSSSSSFRLTKLEDLDFDLTTSSTKNVHDSILSHPVVVKNRVDPSLISSGHVSTESRQVMRKGFDLGLASPGLRMMYDARIKELEEELEVERSARNKSERQRADLQREISSLNDRCEEANDATRAQVEVNRRRDAEMNKLHRDVEELQTQNELQLAAFRKKHQDAVNQLTEQLDQLHKIKQRIEKEKNQQKSELEELKGQLEIANKNKNSAEKVCKQTESQLSEATSRIGDLQRELNDATLSRNRLQQDNVELARRVEELNIQIDQNNKNKSIINKQFEEMKLAVDDETATRNKLLSDNRNLQSVVEQLREQLDEEHERVSDMQRQLIKATNEAAQWRQRYESGEGGIRPEELDDLKKKLGARILDGEAQLEAAVAKAIGLEKAKSRSQLEIEALTAEIDKLQAINNQHDKRQRQFDRLIEEWKRKVADVQTELDSVQKESRQHAADAYKFKTQLDETNELITSLRRDNKNLSEEIHDLTDQINQSNLRCQEIDKVGKRFEQERDELQATLEEAEAALEQQEAKLDRAVTDVQATKDEMERRLMEKDEEFDGVRKNHQRALESLQINLDAETRNKVEAMRVRKKLEQDINELEMALDNVNKARQEMEKNCKKHQQQTRDLQQQLEEEHRARQKQRDEMTASERRSAVLSGEIEELRAQIDVYEKTRKMVEGELQEAIDRIGELNATNATLSAVKKKMEADIQALQSDLDEQLNEVRQSEDQSKKAMADASRLADELRQEQEHSGQIDQLRRNLESQNRQLQQRVDEAETAALHGGRKTIQTLEQRVLELERELQMEQGRHLETQKGIRKQDRKLQEMSLQLDEDLKTQDRMKDMIDKLQQKIKAHKKQLDETEETAAVNVAKYRKLQNDLQEAEARAETAESLLSQIRTKNRISASVTADTSSTSFPGMVIKSTTTTTKQNIRSDA
jgi:chromosome segregation ATPase